MNDKGSLVWRVLYGVVMAGLIAGVFFVYISAQREYTVVGEAQTLANNLSKTAFSALDKQRENSLLYDSVGGSNYELAIDENNNTFIIRILGGDQKGDEYRSSVGVDLEVETPLPGPGESLYLQGTGKKVIVSSTPVEIPEEEKLIEDKPLDPDKIDFYGFAKDNPRDATRIIAAYFYAQQEYPEKEKIDIQEYKLDSSILKARVTADDGFLTTVKVDDDKSTENVGYIKNAWIVKSLESSENNIQTPTSTCHSIRNAYKNGWLYTPNQIKTTLQERNWEKTSNNETVSIPKNLNGSAAAAETNVSTYPTLRFVFNSGGEQYIVHFAAMPWYYKDDAPGFTFESYPSLEAV